MGETRTVYLVSFLAAAFVLSAGYALAQPTRDWVRTEVREDCTDYNALRNAYFGETHVHTAYSLDARLFKTRTDPYDSYEFAKGAVQELPPYDAMDLPTRTYQLNRPLDWMFVSDHAEGLGETYICFDSSYAGYSSQLCTDFRAQVAAPPNPPGPIPTIFLQLLAPLTTPDPAPYPQICGTSGDCVDAAAIVWQDTQDAAEMHYDRTSACTFTTFVGYEFSSQQGGDNLHRNVVFRNEVVQSLPFSAFDSQNPEDLFDNLDATCMDLVNGCEALTITHNANTSRGRMFANTAYDGSALTAADAAQRARIEPLAEIFQNKGNSECRTGVGGATDEDCMFESMGRAQNFGVYDPDQAFQPLSFVREALKEGYLIEQAIGVNPYKVGFVGSTDGHSNLPGAVTESDFGFHGAVGATNTEPEWTLDNVNVNGIDSNGGGLAVVYAEENSRDAIFAAMKRKETYATSGPRIGVRFFGGRMPKDICSNPQLLEEAYNRGVPMGGEIGTVKGPKSPSFLVTAQKDPGGNDDPSTPLQRVEIIKAWVDAEGARQEAVYHVAGTKASSSTASVDLDTCTTTGEGHDSLCAVWSDPKFDARVGASYYVRVTENPVCRWHKHLCVAEGIDCSDPAGVAVEWERCCDLTDDWPETIQERAWTSPIFYEPDEVGVRRGQIKYGKNGGDDRLKMTITLGKLPADFDVAANDLTLILRDDDDILNVTIPAGSFVASGTKFKYSDKNGALGGINKILFKPSTKKPSLLKISTLKTNLSVADANTHKVEFELAIGSYRSIDETLWEYDGKKLGVPK